MSERATCFDVGYVILKLITFLKDKHVCLSVSLRMTQVCMWTVEYLGSVDQCMAYVKA